MPKKAAAKKAKKSAVRKTAGKIAKKAATKKTATGKKTVKKKVLGTKPTGKSKATKQATNAKAKRKPTNKTTSRKQRSSFTLKTKDQTVAPGPQPVGIPSVEEPAATEEAVGIVTHYYSHLGVAVVQLNKGMLNAKDMIHIKGHVTDFVQKIESMQYEHQHVDQAAAGQSVGLKTKDHVREHDIVYLVK